MHDGAVETRPRSSAELTNVLAAPPRVAVARLHWLEWAVPASAALSLLIGTVVSSVKKPLWYDEILTKTLLTDSSLSHMFASMAAGAEAAPPFYHLLARAWIMLFGSGDLAIRLFSWIGFALAAFVVWRLLRSAFDRRASAIGLLAVFCGSLTVLQQTVEVRFYGTLTAVAALCLLLALATMGSAVPSRRLLVGTALAHGGLVLCHFFGFAYSGAILAAIVVWDVRLRRFRPRAYGAVLVGWLAYAPWVGPTLSQAAMGKPRNWTPIPGVPELFDAFGFQIPLLPPLLLGVVFLAALEDARRRRSPAAGGTAPMSSARLMLLHLAYALIAIIPLVFVFSRVAVSLFLGRYLLPASIAVSIVLAEVVTRVAARRESAGREAWWTRAGYAVLAATLVAFPIYRAVSTHPRARPGVDLETTSVAGAPLTSLPIAVESNVAFLPLAYYSPVKPGSYVFPLDWEAAIDPEAAIGAPMETKGMQVFQRQGYFAASIVDGTAFLCAHPRFAVIDSPQHMWFERRILADPAFATERVGEHRTIHGTFVIRTVERRPGASPAGCATGARPGADAG